MRNIGFVLNDFKNRSRRNRCLPRQLFPGRLNGAWGMRRIHGRAWVGRWLALDAWRRMDHRATRVDRRRMNLLPREILRLGLQMSTRQVDRVRRQQPAWPELATFDVRNANCVDDRLNDRQVGRRHGQSCYVLPTTHPMPKAKQAGRCRKNLRDAQNQPVNAGEIYLGRFSRTHGKPFRL